MTRRSKYASNFGASVSVALAEAKTTQSSLADSIGVSTSYVNQTITGHKTASPEWVEIIASTLKLSNERKRELHLAAAKDAGFKL